MKAKEKANLEMTLYWQTIANVRNIDLQERYAALAHDIIAITEGKEPTKSKGLV